MSKTPTTLIIMDGFGICPDANATDNAIAVAENFVPGEPVKVIAYCPLGKDPIAVEIGFTRFALRSSEARRVILR